MCYSFDILFYAFFLAVRCEKNLILLLVLVMSVDILKGENSLVTANSFVLVWGVENLLTSMRNTMENKKTKQIFSRQMHRLYHHETNGVSGIEFRYGSKQGEKFFLFLLFLLFFFW